ncbi:MAG TPA: SRPBCC family protein [Chitinophagaceae bacterium]
MTNQEHLHSHNGNSHSEELRIPANTMNVINVSEPERIISATIGALLFTNGIGRLFSSPVSGLLKAAVGGYLLYRGASGNCALYSMLGNETRQSHSRAVNVRTTMVVNKPKSEVFRYWRKLSNLPLFMKHLRTVQELDSKRSHWEAVLPNNLGVIKWDAEIVEEEEGRKIAWQSVEGSMIENAGKVVFEDALGGQGTKLDVLISYRPPAADLGRGIAKLLGPVVEKYIRQDIANFKDHILAKPTATEGGYSIHHEPAGNMDGEPTDRVYR